MGCFSWNYSDIKRPMLVGNPGILVLPDGGTLETGAYNGYGTFAGGDVYELVMGWNRPWAMWGKDYRPWKELSTVFY